MKVDQLFHLNSLRSYASVRQHNANMKEKKESTKQYEYKTNHLLGPNAKHIFHCNMWPQQRYLGNVVPDYAQSNSRGKIPGAFTDKTKEKNVRKITGGKINSNRQKEETLTVYVFMSMH